MNSEVDLLFGDVELLILRSTDVLLETRRNVRALRADRKTGLSRCLLCLRCRDCLRYLQLRCRRLHMLLVLPLHLIMYI